MEVKYAGDSSNGGSVVEEDTSLFVTMVPAALS